MQPITWGSYLLIWFLLLLIYYVVLALAWLRSPAKAGARRVWQPEGTTGEGQTPVEPFDAASAAPVHALVDELQAFIRQSGQQGTAEEALHRGIRQILCRYPGMAGSVYQEGITNLITVAAAEHCSIHYSAAALNSLWVVE